MPRPNNKLSALFLRKDLAPGLYSDGGGLYLQVSQQKTKAWIFRYTRTGVHRKMGLGPVSVKADDKRITLADARQKATAARSLLIDGIDPIDQRDAKRAVEAAERAKVVTFRTCAEKCIAARAPGWKSAKHADQWRSTLETYAYPFIGHLAVGVVDTGLVLKILEQTETDEPDAPTFWASKTETASRVRGRIETVLDWAKARELRDGENPARWRGHLDQILPSKSSVAPVEHHKALPYADIPAFMADLRAMNSMSARALEFTILTAVRTSDTIEGFRAELDLPAKTWTIPRARIKGKKGVRKSDHVVPLCDRACQLLTDATSTSGLLFPGSDDNTPLSNMAMLELLQGMGYDPDLTVHGFRSTFKDWCAETTDYPNELSEMALAHTVSDKVERAYRRGSMREKRKQLMADWAAYCGSATNAEQ
ncbi:tyrosine-type recombinase/integrase [Tardiphaga sp.]|uniref:tyrosine-type recombinase/integrase n=1 Tax=Tardiphaga sp. TaxID=1926292 RepID=UPI00352A7AEB